VYLDNCGLNGVGEALNVDVLDGEAPLDKLGEGVGDAVVKGEGEGSPGHKAINESATLTALILQTPTGAVVTTSGDPLQALFVLNWLIEATVEEQDVRDDPDVVVKQVSTGYTVYFTFPI